MINKNLSKTVYVFSSIGAQYAGMGHQLYAREPAFRTVLEQCDRSFQATNGWSLCETMFLPEYAPSLAQPEVTLPVLFAFQRALSALWQAYGVIPSAVVGYGMGEITAACEAGMLSLEDSFHILQQYAHLIREAERGAMAEVNCTVEQIEVQLQHSGTDIGLVAVHEPERVVIAGSREDLEGFVATLRERQLKGRMLQASYPFHHHSMRQFHEMLLTLIQSIQPQQGSIPMFSTINRSWVNHDTLLDAEYWAGTIHKTIYFGPTLQVLHQTGYTLFLEINARPIMLSALQAYAKDPAHAFSSLRAGRRGQEYEAFHQTLADLRRIFESKDSTCQTLDTLSLNARFSNTNHHIP